MRNGLNGVKTAPTPANEGCFQNPPLFAEFFAGIGLVHAGLAKGGWRCVYANDIDPKKREMYEAFFGDAPYYHVEDVWKTENVVEKIHCQVDLATASFPCVDLSVAGHRKGLAGKESGSFHGFAKVVERLGQENRPPKTVLIENVMGFLTAEKGRSFETVVKTLGKMGYWLDVFMVDAKHFTPQSRPRLFVFGSLEPYIPEKTLRRSTQDLLSECRWNAAVEARPDLRPKRVVEAMREIELDTGWLLFHMGDLPAIRRDLHKLIDTDESQSWWTGDLVEKHLNEMRSSHRETVEKLRRSKQFNVATVYRRVRRDGTRSEVRTDGLAGCLRTPRGGSSKQIVLVAGKGDIRMRWMTPREYARLQGAPDFPITVPRTQALFGFGDAVCLHVIEWIVAHLLAQVFSPE